MGAILSWLTSPTRVKCRSGLMGPATAAPASAICSQHSAFMGSALAQARLAWDCGEVPIGCVIVDDLTGQIIGTGHNRRECDHDATAHAEILAIRQAGTARGH